MASSLTCLLRFEDGWDPLRLLLAFHVHFLNSI